MARRKKKSREEDVTSVLWREKWIIVAIAVLLLLFLVKIAGYEPSSAASNARIKPVETVNTTDRPSWSGNDPALGHEVGREGVADSWTSGDGGYGYLATGPHVNLGLDYYNILFEMKTDAYVNESLHVATIEIMREQSYPVARRNLYGRDFNLSGEYTVFSIPLVAGKILKDVEFRVLYPNSQANLTLKKIMLASSPTSWSASDKVFEHEIGREGVAGTWTSGGEVNGYLVSGGPHLNLAPGVYDVSYVFVVDEFIDESTHIATIEITHDGGRTYLPGKLTGEDFNRGRTTDQVIFKSFGNRLYIDDALNDVEFKLYCVNSTADVVLKDIYLFIL